MMKKNGFTLAEVLITLAIIGVVATMTLPALMTNTGEQQAKTALRKAINTLTEAAQMSKAVDGFNYDDIVDTTTAINADTDDNEKASIIALLRARTAVDYTRVNDTIDCASNECGANYYDTTVFFRDGSALLFKKAPGADKTVMNDNMTNGFIVVLDTNGTKAPNALSNCAGTKNGAIEEQTDALTIGDWAASCKDKKNRVINDRFLIRLRGSVAQPEGLAANWAYNN